MKAVLAVVIIIAVIFLFFWIAGSKKTIAPGDDAFSGPTAMPSSSGPGALLPQ